MIWYVYISMRYFHPLLGLEAESLESSRIKERASKVRRVSKLAIKMLLFFKYEVTIHTLPHLKCIRLVSVR